MCRAYGILVESVIFLIDFAYYYFIIIADQRAKY